MSDLELLYIIPFSVVIIGWFVFAAVFVFIKRPPKAVEQQRDPRATVGVALEGIAFGLVWMFRRSTAYLIPVPGVTFDIFIAVIVCVLTIASVWMIIAAVKTLGKQWAIAARVVEGHQLITTGPYAHVRNPIYSGMLGMLVATGLAWSTWRGLAIAVIVFWFGTIIRIKIEEKLLRETFGDEFDAYAKRVPSLIPILFL